VIVLVSLVAVFHELAHYTEDSLFGGMASVLVLGKVVGLFDFV
jgi:hypothetical protein